MTATNAVIRFDARFHAAKQSAQVNERGCVGAIELLPLGKDEKLFLKITGDGLFAPETQVLGNPRDVRTGAYYIRSFGWR